VAPLDSSLKIGLDELRTLMLGTQVAFGFQFQSLFQDRLDISARAIQTAALSGLLPASSAPQWTAAVAICVLLGLWYGLPLALRSQREFKLRSAATPSRSSGRQ